METQPLSEVGDGDPIAPHPVLSTYYAAGSDRAGFVRSLFNDAAAHYDRVNRWMSLGSGARYRRRRLQQAGLHPGLRVVDIAIGTGLVAQEAVAITGHAADIIGLDVSEGMLAQARRALAIPLIQARAEQLPLAAMSVDFLCMGYALRHVFDLRTMFHEFHRVLRPGGTVLLLEIARPDRAVPHRLLNLYLGRLIPLILRWGAGGEVTRMLLRYYWETIETCVAPGVILNAMTDAGFVETRCETDWAILRNYIGRKA